MSNNKFISPKNIKHIFIFALLYLVSPLSAYADVNIGVATNFCSTMENIVDEYIKTNKIDIYINCSSSGILAQQISHGASFSLFYSADDAKSIRNLAKDSYVYAYGTLVLFSNTEITDDIEAILSNDNTISIANDRLAPYGIATQQVLRYFSGILDVKYNLVTANSIAGVFAHVQSSNAPYGFTALSVMLSNNIPSNRYIIINTLWHAPIAQTALLLDNTNKEAQKFFDYTKNNDNVKTILKSHGYIVSLFQ